MKKPAVVRTVIEKVGGGEWVQYDRPMRSHQFFVEAEAIRIYGTPLFPGRVCWLCQVSMDQPEVKAAREELIRMGETLPESHPPVFCLLDYTTVPHPDVTTQTPNSQILCGPCVNHLALRYLLGGRRVFFETSQTSCDTNELKLLIPFELERELARMKWETKER